MGIENYLDGGIICLKAAVDLEKVEKFGKVHDKHLAKIHSTEGAGYEYKFTTTGIGIAVKVICPCGKRMNITDYASW